MCFKPNSDEETRFMAHWLWISILLATLFVSTGNPRPTPTTNPTVMQGDTHLRQSTLSPVGPVATIDFLRKYGYLDPGSASGSSSETIYSEESVRVGLMQMQKFGGLEGTGLLDAETRKLLITPRCGVPDILQKNNTRLKRYVIGSMGWNKRLLTYSFQNWSPKLGQYSAISDMETAMETWANYTNLRFRRMDMNSDADIMISFGRGYHGDSYPFDGKGYTLAHAYFPSDYGHLAGDIHFDEDEDWWSVAGDVRYGTENPISFVHVAAHELGHSLGLAHSSDRESIMFPYYNGKQGTLPTLGYDDIRAVYQLYIQRYIPDSDDTDDNHGSNSDERRTSTARSSTTYQTTYSESSSTSESGSDENYDGRLTTERPRDVTMRPMVTPSIPVTTTQRATGESSGDGSNDSSGEKSTELSESGEKRELEKIKQLCSNLPFTISFLRNEIFVFRDQYMWRLGDRGMTPAPAYPVKIGQLFSPLTHLDRVDAAYERESDGKLIFFSGNQFWELDGTQETGTDNPKALTSLGLPSSLKKLDGAFVWEKNLLTYFFSGSLYWRYNETSGHVDEGYPMKIEERWGGIPAPIGSVLRWRDGKTYFFSEGDFWRFDDTLVHAEEHFPLRIRPHWFNCQLPVS